MAEAVAYRALADLPPAALALFGADAFSTLDWYRATLAAALPAGAVPSFHVVTRGAEVLAVLPMLREAGGLRALTTPYTCLWQPLAAPGADAVAVGHALAPLWRRHGAVRLDCLPPESGVLDGIFIGLRACGLRVLPFDHFGNWHLRTAGLDWAGYLAARPGQLRSPLVRQVRRLMQGRGASFTLAGRADLDAAIAAYDAVYAASWKKPEPYPAFNANFMRASMAAGRLRLGVLWLDGAPIAAQFWLLHGDWVAMLKVAYDQAHAALAPGNVLSALILQHLLDHEHVAEIDFGRGDDSYKRMWTGSRRQRMGAVIANPNHVGGAIPIIRHTFRKFVTR